MDSDLTYSKLQILLKSSNKDLSLTRIEYEQCSYQIVNNYFIIKIKNDESSSFYKIFNMNELDSFKTEK
jgi:hypothetical protein